MSEEFELYDLKVTVTRNPNGNPSYSIQKEGSYFLVQGENLVFEDETTFPMYALAAIIPLLPAKQRVTDPVDWMTTDACIADPDPHSGAMYKIERLGRRTFRRADVTAVPLNPSLDQE